MSIEENKAVAEQAVEAINSGDFSLLESLVASDGLDHAVPPGMPPTRDSAIQFLTMFRTAFPDLHYTLEDVIAEGDRVVQRATARGTMKGDFLGMPATGKSASWGEVHIVRIADGKIVEHWASVDQLGMLQQLGLAPVPGA
jgi:steroid delta-isomerase-like uncharacterized protein